MSGGPQSGWPAGVRELGVADLKRLGIDRDNQIYWDGRRIEIRKSIPHRVPEVGGLCCRCRGLAGGAVNNGHRVQQRLDLPLRARASLA
jgi:hypothetical protein